MTSLSTERIDARLRALVARGRSSFREQAATALHLLRTIVLGAMSGALAGLASFVFLESLDRVTRFRLHHPWLLWLLPLAALATGLAYHLVGGRSGQGNALLIEEIHEPTAWVPRRMAPLVFVGTIVSHLFGASVGREGTALQMSGSLTDLLSRVLRLGRDERRLLLVAAIAGGFGSVFGVPLAGAVFGLEVQSVGRVRYEALVPALAASIVGDRVVRGLGYHHAARAPVSIHLTTPVALKVAVAGVAFGLVAAAFVWLSDALRDLLGHRVGWPPLRLALGGAATAGLAALVGRDYLGLSLPLMDRALAGHQPHLWVFVLKLVFTAVALGSGIPGGEVTPLFVIGATLGAALAGPLGLPIAVGATVGFVGVFAGAANTPLACTIMGVELFGSGLIVPLAVACVMAYVFSAHTGIYSTQQVVVGKRPKRTSGGSEIGP
jgi:H+/Cl- antiporter ClcA